MWTVNKSDIEKLLAVVDYSEALTLHAGPKEAQAACEDAKRYGFRAVVAFPWNLGIQVDAVKGSGVLAQIAVGFPCGNTTTKIKCLEAEEGLARGAADLDMVMNLGAFKSGDYKKVSEDIRSVLAVARPFNVPFKVIIEVGILSDDEIVAASKLVKDAGADFVKTCTGFGPGRATNGIIELIRETIGPEMGIKASGGVASIEDGIGLMKAGATVVAFRRHLVDKLEKIGWETRK
ncbi:MAG: deoxyribose-phosphate aldolase [Treponema sp.]|nr:deoxyribose-phosphate aldolase [Treponema sp.]